MHRVPCRRAASILTCAHCARLTRRGAWKRTPSNGNLAARWCCNTLLARATATHTKCYNVVQSGTKCCMSLVTRIAPDNQSVIDCATRACRSNSNTYRIVIHAVIDCAARACLSCRVVLGQGFRISSGRWSMRYEHLCSCSPSHYWRFPPESCL